MTSDQAYTAGAIAEIMGISRQAIMKRAKKEGWTGVNGNGKGGDHIKYPLPALPAEIQLAIYNKEGAPAEMLPALSPAVALAAMERQVAAPTFAQVIQPSKPVRGRRGRVSRPGSLLPETAPAGPAHVKNAVFGSVPEKWLARMAQEPRSQAGTNDDKGDFEEGAAEPLPDSLGGGSGRTPAAPSHNNKDIENGAGSSVVEHLGSQPGEIVSAKALNDGKGCCERRSNGRRFESCPAPLMSNCGLEPARRYAYEDLPAWSPERAISEDTLRNPRVGKILAILREVEAMPRNWTKGANAWKKYVAIKHGVALQSVYRYLQKYDKRGIAGLEHRKSNAGKSKAWTPEALDHWIGLTLKPEMRKMTLKALYYDCLIIEVQRRNWTIGCYESAVWWYNKRATPEMRAMRDGGMRALDNLLPPVLRDYSDLAPFEMLVGDQHRFDFWVVDDDTGIVFRPEGYVWQDLRTRIIYGAAFDRRYDAHLCGEALRIGMRIYGCFNAIYTDNGSSELSKYIMGILAEIRRLGMEWNLTIETPMDLLDVDGEDVQPVVAPIAPGTHKRAIVKNAKAKLIEKTFDILEETLRSTFRLPGSVKRLSDDIHTQDVDHQEAIRLAAEGKLLLASEFYLTVYRALDWYNREKAHRGVRREWAWKPVPAAAAPMDCLMACYRDGWRPRAISDEAADLVFLKRIKRTIQLGRITIDGEIYEHDSLLGLPQSQPVECRIRPFETDVALVYLDGKFLCPAHPVEYSSMKDGDLAARKIVEKREKRKAIADRFRAMIKGIPDLREYSQIPEAEKVAAVVGEERKRIEAARANLTRALAPEELAAEMVKLEALNERLPDGRSAAFAMSAIGKPIPPRPDFFLSAVDRHLWCVKCEAAGVELSAEDRAFVEKQEAAMTQDQRDRWQFEREYGNG